MGLCNLDVATGLQNKIFTYMSYGIPAVISQKSHPGSLVKQNRELLVYDNEKQLINCIFKLIENKSFQTKFLEMLTVVLEKNLVSQKLMINTSN